MFKGKCLVRKQEAAREKLIHYLDTIGMEELKEDSEERAIQVRALLRRFPEDLDPDSRFWRVLSRTVRQAFPEGLAENSALARRVHQFRYVISAQQVQYIRRHYRREGETDQEALAHYAAATGDWTTREPERFHQKHRINDQGQVVYPDGSRGPNIKICFNRKFHSEFILNREGRFLFVLDENGDVNSILNGSSFNYASRNDPGWDPWKWHRKLDIHYGENDPRFRKVMNLDKKGKRIYRSPTKGNYRSEGFLATCSERKKDFAHRVHHML